MTDPQGPESGDPVDTPAQVDVVVVGAGVAGLLAARDIARAGFSVMVVDPAANPGGAVGRHTVAGLNLDSGAESFAVRGGSVAALADDLGLGGELVSPSASGAWLHWQGGAAPLPKRAVLGIPGVPLADDVRAIIGWRGSLRAQLDRYMPLLRVRSETDLGELVRRRMGRRVLERLVAPIVGGVHSAHPDLVDVHAVAPGLTQAMTVQGSLSGAVLSLIEDRGRASGGRPGSAVGGIDGGVHRLVDALVVECRRYGADLRWGVGAHSFTADGDLDRDPAAEVRLTDGSILRSRAVVIAATQSGAIPLLGSAGVPVPPLADWPGSAPVTLVTLVIDDSRLDAAPRGTGVLVAEGTPGVRAKALTHATAKWSWLAREAGPGRHVIRLSYGRHGDGPAAQPTAEQAVHDASILLGVPLDMARIVDFAVVEWRDALAFATVGHSARIREVSAALEGFGRIRVVGGWFDGTGLASIVGATRPRTLDLNARLRIS